MKTLSIRTHEHEEMVDITTAVRRLINENGWPDGALLLYCPHTTGAVTVKRDDMQYPEQT